MTQQIVIKPSPLGAIEYRMAFEHATVGIACVAFDGRFLEVNSKFCELVDNNRNELLQLTLQELIYSTELNLWLANTIQDLDNTQPNEQNSKTATCHTEQSLFQDCNVFSVYCRRKTGEIWAVEISISYVDSKRRRFFIHSRDIREQHLDKSLLKLRRQLSNIISHATTEILMQTALNFAETLTNSQIGFFHFVSPDQRAVSLQVWSSNTIKTFCSAEGNGLHYPVSKAGVWVDCIHQRRPVMHNDYAGLSHKRGFPKGHPKLIRELTVPIMRENVIVAVIGVGNKETDYNETHVRLVQEIGEITFDYIERKRAEDRVRFMTNYDALTGLPNRAFFFERFTQAMVVAKNTNSQIALAYIDLDGFKLINDHYGHDIGDQLLIALAKRLAEPLRKSDILARPGGDEFALLLTDLTNTYEGEGILRRVIETLERPFQVAGREIWLSACSGFTIYPLDNAGAETLLRHADQAMCQAKRKGKSTICLYDSTSDKRKQFHQQTIKELIKATTVKDELIFYYQPKVNMITNTVIGVEALIRWHHPLRGLLRPNEFLPGLNDFAPEAMRLDKWVINQALNQIAAWEANGESFPVSVNIYYKNLCQKWFIDFIRKQALQRHKSVISNLEIEVQNSADVTDFESLAQAMASCVELGIKFVLDDFGTGCSALNRFWHLPIKAITLDRKFVQGMLDNAENLKIVEEVTCLAQEFQLPVIAKGVETLELAALLIDLDCPIVQGYSIAQPMAAEFVANWYRSWSGDIHHKNLRLLGQDDTVDALILVVILAVQTWRDCITQFAITGGLSERPLLCDDQCIVTHWHNGLGKLRYGDRPVFPFLDARHHALHVAAADLVGLIEEGLPYQEHLNNLYMQIDEFAALLKNL